MNNLENPSPTQKKDNLIPLYPFNGRSSYLIDKFYIIGYNYITLEKLLITSTPKIIEEEKDKDFKEPKWSSFIIEEEPTILNEITNDYNKEGLDSKTILQMIFPHKLKCYYTWEENVSFSSVRTVVVKNLNDNDELNFSKIEFKHKGKDEPKGFRSVFSSNPQTGNNSKKSINGFSHTFYRKFIPKKNVGKRNYIYYVPYTFCITSEFPYFTSFNKMITIIKKIYSQDCIYIPIEIILYNIINLSPSPLNSDIIIDLNSSCSQDETFGNLKDGLISSKKNSDKNIMFNLNLEKKTNFIKTKTEVFEDKKKSNKTNLLTNKKNVIQAPNPNQSQVQQINQKKFDLNKIEFKFLSGYPLIQYNLPRVLFQNLSIEKIITIFLYMFLEKDVIFFSKDILYLTLAINAFLNLNFPLNDEKYYFIGCAISLKDFIEGNSEFGMKNYTSVIGINDSYSPEYRSKNIKINDHLVVDLDKGNIICGEEVKDKFSKTDENNKKLVKLIEKICKDTQDEEKIASITLYLAIKNLSRRLKYIYEKSSDISTKSIRYEFLEFNDKPALNNIQLNNRDIQESFYQFIQYICLYFYENLTIKATDDEYKAGKEKPEEEKKEFEMNVIFDEENINEKHYNEEELIFLTELKTTMKYQSFVYIFLQSYNPIDLYKIPLTFTEEFLSIISRKKEELKRNISKIQFFKLIDSLYYKRNVFGVKEISFVTINFSYFRNFKNRFDREIFDRNKKRFNYDKTNMIKFISNEQRMIYYQTYELDDNILLKYIHLIKNFTLNEHIQMFSNSFFVEENILEQIQVTNIETLVENNCISEDILTKSDICCSNILLLFSISLKSLRDTIDCQEFLSLIFQRFTVFRKYYSILLRTLYKLYKVATTEKKNSNIGIITTLCYYPCINSIRGNRLVPNEDLMNMIVQFNKININELSLNDKKEENKEEENKEEKDENNDEIKLYGKQLEEKDITYKNLYIFKNFNSQKFFGEKAIVDFVNKTNKFELMTNTKEKILPQIRFYNGIHKIESFFISQKDMLESLIKEYELYIENLDDSKLNSKIILDSCLNIFLYMRNTPEFEGMDDIFETLKTIFYIFLNRLFILKSQKEKIERQKQN